MVDIGTVFAVKGNCVSHMLRRGTMRLKRIGVWLLSGAAIVVMIPAAPSTRAQTLTGNEAQQDCATYGGAPENNHYSKLQQINRSNIKQLEVAWSFDTGEEGGLQSSPVIVSGIFYGISPTQKIFALDASTGKLLWRFDSGIRGTQPNRGLAYWTDGKEKRILVGVMNFLYALDAVTGRPIPTFGDRGRIDLRENLGREPASAQSREKCREVIGLADRKLLQRRAT
jgi:glucose dehydrogenase